MARALAEVGRQTVAQLARSKWASSGLSDKVAKKLGLRGLSRDEVRKRGMRFQDAAALLIPYWDLDGSPTKFFRLRYLEKLPGAAGLSEKPQRYDQLPVMQEAYYPPILKTSWREIAKDSECAVGITEGELKAASACSHGIPVFALGGVYSFMSQKRGIALLPSMQEFDWKGRVVWITYDNDVADKAEVMEAQRRITQALLAEGALVKYAPIPPGPAKGLDDFILAHGKDAYLDLVGKAVPSGECEALWKLNEEVVFIRSLDTVLERKTGMMMEPNRFMNHLYANRFHHEQIIKGSGKNAHPVLEKVPTARKWIEWEQRAELDGITYGPGGPRVGCSLCMPGLHRTQHAHDQSYNTWKGWGTSPKRGTVQPWTDLLDFLFSNDEKARKYFEQWCAYPVQNPGAKMFTAVLLWSRVKRLGKSLIGLALSQIYGDNSILINSKQLKSSFSGWAKDRQLVIGEEITAGEARIDADYLKDLITSPVFTINQKFQPEFVIPNHTNFLFFSNHPDALFLEDGDKRYMIHGITHERPAPKSVYNSYIDWLHHHGASHLMKYFLDMSMRGFRPEAHAPDTSSKFQMIVAGKTDVGLWVQKLKEDPTDALVRQYGEKISQGCDLFSSEELKDAMDPEGKWKGQGVLASLGKHLVNAGFHQLNVEKPVQVHIRGGGKALRRLYAIRNLVKWDQSTREEVQEHRETYFGPQQAGEVK